VMKSRKSVRTGRAFGKLFVELLENRALPSVSTQVLKDINTGTGSSNPAEFTQVGSITFFVAADSAHGLELWKTNGTSAGTVLVRDIEPAAGVGSFPQSLTNVNGTLFFTANTQSDSHGLELWKSNGTSAGTVLVRDINPTTTGGNGSYPNDLVNVNGTLYFVATESTHGAELWKSNGTSSGTVLVCDIQPGADNGLAFDLTNVNGVLFFSASGPGTGQELWKTNGTSAGTVLVRDICVGANASQASQFINVNGTLFFTADDGTHGLELWKSNGTSSGTVVVRDINPGANGSVSTSTHVKMLNLNGTLFFAADDGTHGQELWKTNGSSVGTVMVSDMIAGSSSGFVPFTDTTLVSVGSTILFALSDPTHGLELWKSNGTSAGTSLVRDINPGTNGSDPVNLTNVNGTLYFSAADGAHGKELWQSNGTSAGTTLVRDILSGSSGSFPEGLTNLSGRLYFNAFNTSLGDEPWTADLPNTAPVLNAAKTPILKTIAQNTTHPIVGTPGGTAIGTLVDFASPAGQLDNVTDADSGALLGIAVTAADTSHGVWSFSIDKGASWHSLGTPSAAAARTLAADGNTLLYFTPAVGFSGMIASAITFRAWDRTSGINGSTISTTAAGGTTAFSTALDTASLIVNDAPVLDVGKSPKLNDVVAGSGNPSGAVGTLTSQLVDFKTPAGQLDNVTDVNSGALLGIAVTRVDTTHGTWFYSINNGTTWLTLGASTTVAKLLAVNGQTRLYFKPTPGFTGTVAQAISFRAWDRTTGGNGGTADVTTAGGATAFSRYGDTASVSVV
jgi:ELWxxDGT repeat protein